MWDSGLRPVPVGVLPRARVVITEHTRNSELLSLDQLARELGIHQRTLRAAARTGRLKVTFSVRSVFGRLIRFATRAAGQAFMRTHYRHYGRPRRAVAPLPSVPHDYHLYLKRLRHRLRLTQDDLARRIGAANKAVVYQWESRKRRPSPVFWQRIEALGGTRLDARRTPVSAKDQPRAFRIRSSAWPSSWSGSGPESTRTSFRPLWAHQKQRTTP